MRQAHATPFGAQVLESGGVRFRLWAPGKQLVCVELITADDAAAAESWPMQRDDDGWHERVLAHAAAGTHYRYRVDDDLAVADPASRFNPSGVHGPSEVVDPDSYEWQHADWGGRAWHEAVLYELHLGTFTPDGTLLAAAARLPQLRALGFTAIEMMPIAAFSGERGWGYDGVLPFAPASAYGTPDDLKRFVDTAHGLGLMVLLDVVYNHFGPDGNYLAAYCPEFFNPQHQTPWGSAINFDGNHNETVRRFFIDNALQWVVEYRFDGLRLDAVHAIRDDSDTHIVADIAEALRTGPGRERAVHLVLENDANTVHPLLRGDDDRPLQATAQWNDDLHHAAHVLATDETHGYYAPYADSPAALFGRSMAEGFLFQDRVDAGAAIERGQPSALLPSQAFVVFLQNHDHIGNRAFGERLDALASTARVEALLACVLLSPPVPMMFMGEEFAASTPFLYFCDFHGELGAAVARGRRAEFARFPAFSDPETRERIPDPNAVATFNASKLRWSEADSTPGASRLALVTQLLGLRHQLLVPLLAGQRHGGTVRGAMHSFVCDWLLADGTHWILRANFSGEPVEFDTGAAEEIVYRLLAEPIGEGRSRLESDGVEIALQRGPAPIRT